VSNSSHELRPGQRRTAWLLVVAQFALIAVIVLSPDRADWPVPSWLLLFGTVGSWAGIAIMVVAGLGLGRGLTAAPLPNSHAKLRTGGLYRLVRHPIYTGLLLFTLAHVATSGSALVALAGVLLILLINAKARWEEKRLTERFLDYSDYARRTPRFVPWLPRRDRAV